MSEPKWTRLPDVALHGMGWRPELLADDPDQEGPFAAIREEAPCRCCGQSTLTWTVVDLSTGDETGHAWTGGNADVDAYECASELNHVWAAGHDAARAALAKAKGEP